MDRNKLFLALGVLAVLGVATYFAYKKPADDATEALHDPWHAVDKTQTTKIVIQRPNNAPAIEIEKRDNHWFMNQPAQGPADEAAVNEVLTSLSEMHVASIASRETASHAEMQVDAANAIHVQLFHAGAPQLDLFVGKNLDGGTAVRGGTGPIVYRVDRAIRYNLAKEPREWRDRQVTQFDRTHVHSVEWQNARGTYHFDRNGDTWTAATTNPPIERLDTARLNQTINNLIAMRATDFAAAGSDGAITPTSPRVTVTADGDAGSTSATLVLGGPGDAGAVYVRREGNPVIFAVARTHSAEIDLDPTNIQTPLPSPDAGNDAATDAAAANPNLHVDASISPEMMEQIRQQLRQRGMGMPPGH